MFAPCVRIVIPTLVASAVALAGLASCATQPPASCPPGSGSPVAVFTLFMGKAIAGRGDLTDAEWQSFLGDTVIASLPNGYTVFEADGGWLNPTTHTPTREATKVLMVALPETPTSLAAVNRVRAAYQIRFRQQLVGMTVARACGDF